MRFCGINRDRLARRGGFSLIEVTIAVAIFFICMFALLSLMTQSLNTARRLEFVGSITAMDAAIGRLLDLLDEYKITDNTIVIFFSDNGGGGAADNAPLRGRKGQMFEGGIRVPLIVRWPGKVKAGSTSSFMTGLEDWLPTLLAMTGLEEKTPDNIDGISIAATLSSHRQARRPFLYREFSGYGGQQAVWMGKWKGIRQNMLRKNNADPLKIELYDLQADISESRDVAAENPQVVARIRTLMAKQHTPSELFPLKPLDQ